MTINAPGANGLVGPSGLTIGPDNNIYFSGKGTSAADNAIYRYNTQTQAVTTFISAAQLSTVTGGSAYGPAGLKFGPDGKLYVCRSIGQTANPFTGALDRFSASGSFETTIASGLSQPTSIYMNGNDMLVSNLIGANANGFGDIVRIRNFTTTPSLPETFISTGSGNLENPTGMAAGPNGDLFVADVSYGGNSAVRRYTSGGTPVGVNNAVITAPFQFTSDLFFREGKLYIANLGNPDFLLPGGIYAYNANTLAFDSTIANGTGFGSLAFNPVPEPGLLGVAGIVIFGMVRGARRK
jgi:hypothetical protein